MHAGQEKGAAAFRLLSRRLPTAGNGGVGDRACRSLARCDAHTRQKKHVDGFGPADGVENAAVSEAFLSLASRTGSSEEEDGSGSKAFLVL